MSNIETFIRAKIDEDIEEAYFVAHFNNTATWRYDDGVEASERESLRRSGGAYKVVAHERVRGPHTHIDFAGDYPALTREMQFIAKNDPARTLRIMNALTMILDRTDDVAIQSVIASIWSDVVGV